MRVQPYQPPSSVARPGRIRLQVAIDGNGRTRVLPDFPVVKPKSTATEISRGSVTVKIYKTKWRDKKRRKAYASHTVIWKDAFGKRQRQKRASFDQAKAVAERVATGLANGEQTLLEFSQADRASVLRARELLQQIGDPPLEVAIGHYVQLVMKLAATPMSPEQAIQFAIEHQPKGVKVQNVPDLVAALLAEKERHGCGKKWLRTLKKQLDRFAAAFACPLHALRAHEISAWLDGLKGKAGATVGLRTRKNYRDAIRELVLYAQKKGQLLKTWDELDRVEDPAPPPVEVEIYTPEQLLKLLHAARPNMVPFIALQAFAGIRHEEMTGTKALLDWRDIKFDKGLIVIKKTVGKTKKQRLIEMHPNLIAWLKPYAKDSGPVCVLKSSPDALVKTKKRANLPSGRGELTNALRSSFISYRVAETNDIGLTSREAGNSPQIIQQHYLELVTDKEAARFFGIFPTHADIVQLRFSGL
jgi:integrase